MQRLYQKLNTVLEGTITTDDNTLRLYSTDASLYQIKPKAVAFPKNTEDCQKIVEFASSHNISITPRGAGTSLAGQAVGPGIVIDMSRYLNHIIQINPATKTATVQAGVIPTSINAAAAPFDLFFPPNPSTDNRCNIGGMVGNNSWGSNAPIYGDTSDYLEEIELILADATIVKFADVTQQQLEQIYLENSRESELYKSVINHVIQQRKLIQSYPWYTQAIPNNMGYRLHKLLNRITDPQSLGPPFNMSQLICGSEGTLGLITEITVSLNKRPAHRNLMCAHFNSLFDALNAVPLILSQSTVTIELLDKNLIELASESSKLKDDTFWLNSAANAVLLIESLGDDADQLEDINASIRNNIESKFETLGFYTLTDDQTSHAWSIRKSVLGMLFATPENMKAVSFVEDVAVPVQQLTEFTQRVKDVLSMLNIRCVFYGSVSRGLLHIRPLLDLSLPLHKEYLKEIQLQIFSLVENFGGSISAKHGDGRIRAASIKSILGDEYIDACLSIKKSFDPENIFNPGSIFSEQTDLENIRPQSRTAPPANTLATSSNNSNRRDEIISILQPSISCHGAAVCRQTSPELNICPTYRAVHDEAMSTRGRANIIRQSITTFNAENEPIIDHTSVNQAIHHCLACQACKTDCPANVDMASIKIQWLNLLNKSHAMSLEKLLYKNFSAVCAALSIVPTISNTIANFSLTKSLLNSSQHRQFPKFRKTRFSQQIRTQLEAGSEDQSNRSRVIIINDVFTEHFEQDVGAAACAVISKMGYNISLTPTVTALRVYLNSGWFDQAREQLRNLVYWLDEHSKPEDIIIGLEPSEVMVFHNECMELSRGTSWYSTFTGIKSRIMLLDEFIVQQQEVFVSKLSRKNFKQRTVYLHTHCHQKSNHMEQCTIDALKLLPNCSVKLIKTGCCGMAGNFGYQKDNYDLSVKVAQLDLLPAISKASTEDIIVATGTSCRTQISDLTDKTAIHTSQLFSNYVNNLIA